MGPFLKQYYESQDFFSSPIDIAKNIDQYKRIGTYSSIIINSGITTISQFVDFSDETIYVNSTFGWPSRYGLLKVNDEIITYTGIGSTSFNGCIRGFSGITTYNFNGKNVSYETTTNNTHGIGSTVYNLSNLFLKEFFKKTKYQFLPGFEDLSFYENIDQKNILIQGKDFYSTKGTAAANNILFKSLYGEEVKTINPQQYLLKPSDNDYRLVKQVVVEALEGDPLKLEGKSIFQEVSTSVGIITSFGSVSAVEPNFYGGNQYYTIDVDFGYDRDISTFGSIFGDIAIHPKTKIVGVTSSSLLVDSTIGFPSNGIVVVNNIKIPYNQKTNTEFLECNNINLVDTNIGDNVISNDYQTYGYDDEGSQILLRVTGVLEKLNIIPETYNYYIPGDPVLVKSLGLIKDKNDVRFNSWKFNNLQRFDVASITFNGQYFVVTTFGDHQLSLFDEIEFVNKVTNESIGGKVERIITDEKIQVSANLPTNEQNLEITYFLRRKIKTTDLTATNNPYISDVQNVYDLGGNVLVTSPSLPSYQIESNKRSVSFTLSGFTTSTQFFIPNHNFYSGDIVKITSSSYLNLKSNNYFIKKIDNDNVKLSLSNSNIDNQIYEKFENLSDSPVVLNLTPIDNSNNVLTSQKIVREIKSPEASKEGNVQTIPGNRLGILINGVEILNYKSEESVYYGPIESIDVLDGGEDYDIINPPIVNIQDSQGVGATATCAVVGNLKEIKILDGGFDYLEVPKISISGGNGRGAKAEAKLTKVNHDIYFNASGIATFLGGFISTDSNIIGFGTEHKLNLGEAIIYNSLNNVKIGIGSTSGDLETKGFLKDDAVYYVSFVNDTTIKLHNSEEDAIFGRNEINLTSVGSGNQRFRSTIRKNIITGINIIESGAGYENKKRLVDSIGINTANDTINIKNHGFNSGELVTYNTSGNSIAGLSTSQQYYVTKVDNDKFRLSLAGIGTTISNENYVTKQYIRLKNSGSGIHEFNYPTISVSITGPIGLSRTDSSKYEAKIIPIFKGSISSIQVTNGGSGYGSTDIINFDRQPTINLNSGNGCIIKPIVKDSKISDIIILNSGKDYNSIPNFNFLNSGSNAQLTPIIDNGSITSIKVINGGVGFSTSSEIIVESNGKNSKLRVNIKKWTVNLVEKYKNLFAQSKDDGLIISGIGSELQYANLFAPRKLRETLYSKNSDGTNNYKNLDLVYDSYERLSQHHSPIIGWAYDGCPIYGPYGYANATGGQIKCLSSGYQTIENSFRPLNYPLGFFVEDFIFSNNGDLDENNGRFCKTPDYPDGVYAYFCTINSEENGYDSNYLNYRRPVFPYVIGNSFKYLPNTFNFNLSSNQNDYNLTNAIRNTYSYKLNNSTSIYEGIIEPQKISNQLTTIDSTIIGSVESIGISSAGYDYKIGDRIIFDNEGTEGDGASAIISELFEDRVVSIASSSISISNVTLTTLDSNGLIEGISTIPHGLQNLDTIFISGISTDSLSKISGFHQINVIENQFTIASGIGTTGITGITTFITLISPIRDSIKLDDIYNITNPGIGTETLLVIGVDPVFNRIKVKREHNNTVGYAYSPFNVISENAKRFRFNSGISTNIILNNRKKLFFNPLQSVGLGTVGLGYTITYEYGNSSQSRFIPLQTIYIQNHKLSSGQKLKYSNEGNSSVVVSSGGTTTTSLSNNSIVYAAKISEDLIGISTLPIGIGSSGGFSGIGLTSNILYFTAVGSGSLHSFETQEDITTASVEKNIADVTCNNNHNLNSNQNVSVNVFPGITTTVAIKYNSTNRRMVCNPQIFNGSGINTATSAITLENHGFKTGDKVIYSSDNPASGLISDEIYYVVYIDNNSFKLTTNLYQTTLSNPEFVGIGSTGLLHEISAINPPINMLEGSTLIFDLSDSSLSDINNGVKLQSFDFDLYESKTFTNKFVTTLSSSQFEVVKTGIVGVTNDAKLSLKVTKNVPSKLYYSLKPLIGKSYISKEKSEIIIDSDVLNNNSLNYVESNFNGNYTVSAVGLGSTVFRINLNNVPENKLYTQQNSKILYRTNSNTATGSISKIDVLYGGRGYKSNPGISSILSKDGYGSILNSESTNIGQITKSTIQTIGFEYPFDSTLKPIAQLPQKLYVEQLYSIGDVGLSSGGKNYTLPPNFVVIDGITGNIKDDVILEAKLSGNIVSEVNILKNTKTLYGLPKIIAINNNNGIGITNLTYNSNTKIVTVDLASGFSTARDFPFAVGSKIFVEGIGITSTGGGYNSSQYGYELFTLIGVTSAIGGLNGSLSFELNTTIDPGIFSIENSLQNGKNSYGKITPEKYLPSFNPSLSLGDFKYNSGESLFINEENVGTIVGWDPVFKLLKVNNTKKSIQPGTIIRGGSTDNRSIVISSFEGYSDFTVGSTNQKLKDYSNNSGKLNTFLQVLQDGNYYQNFSYSLKSKVPIQKWNDSVKSLTHTLGFEKFSDLQIESETSEIDSGLQILESNTDLLIDLVEEKDFDCYYDYASAKELVKSLNSMDVSDQVYFDSLRLLDYTEFVSNRVLKIDDISNQFDSSPSVFNYTTIGTFDVSKFNSAQFYVLIKDSRFFGEKEIIIINVVYDGANGYLTAYGRNETVLDLGSFSFRRSGNTGEILFYPKKYEYNSYNISNINVLISNAGIVGVGTSSLGDVVSFASTAVSISSSPTPSESTVISIPTNTYSSGKILLSASSNDINVQFAEINVISNGSNVNYDIFGNIDSGDSSSNYETGIVGEVGVSTSNGNILVTFTPNPNIQVEVRSLSILIGNTTKVGVDTSILYKGELSSHYVSVASSTAPPETKIAGFSTESLDPHDGALYYIQIHDTTNNEIQFSEVVLTLDSNYNPLVSEFSSLYSDTSLGVIGAAKSTSECHLTFTPNQNIDIQARVFQKTLQVPPKQNPKEINLESSVIRSDTIPLKFEGTQISTLRNFNLTHRSSPIFKKIFDGSSTSIVDLSNNSVKIPNHFFVTGEKIEYSTIGTKIGIATTSISGVGTTNILPSTLYVVKINDNIIKFAETPEKALKFVPEVLNLTSVGIGSSHILTSNYKSNSKSLINIDNIIQNPVVSTAKTTFVIQDTDDVSTSSVISFNDVSGFYAKDLIKIDNEFLLITDIGIGGTNKVACQREQLGTASSIHTAGSIITKFNGNYNIVDDVIYFVESPRGGDGSESYSSFQGRIFLRSTPVGSSNTAYYQNNIFDDISDQFDGKTDAFELKVNGENVTGIVSTNSISAGILLVNNIFQKPKYPATGIAQTYTYEVIENSGISSVLFSGNPVGLTTNNIIGPMKFDVNSASLPRGGVIVSVGSTQGFGFQPLVSAGGTAIVSIAGTIQSISIGNSGSGYRPGIQTSIVVSIETQSGLIPVGSASVSNGVIVGISVTHVGSGYTATNPPKVIIDSPLNYENIHLIYDSTNAGVGTEAKVDIVVGYGNSIIEFNLVNTGYGYSVGDVLTFEIGGNTGIPTNSALQYSPFKILVDEVFNDKFNAWYPGQFVVLDDFDNQFDGFRKRFTLKENGVVANFVVERGSPIQLDQNILVFINDTLQVPNDSYIFNGGSQIEFVEAPKPGSSVKVLFFRGSGSDVSEVEVIPTIKSGDKIKLIDQLYPLKNVYTENQRIVSDVSIVDSVYTSSYFGPGITSDFSIKRTIEWCKQKDDFYLDENIVSKSRKELDSNIFPSSSLIYSVGVGSTSIFVQNVRPLFNYSPEILPLAKQNVKIISQNEKSPAIATAIVSAGGTISDIIILDGGIGFTTSPTISISQPSNGSVAIATCSISGIGTIVSISITNAGAGYTSSNPPKVLIQQEPIITELITGVSYEGDSGIISGVGTTSIAGIVTGITFDFYIPKDSIFRDSSQVGSAITVSGIQTGYYFVVYDSTIGNGVTSINDDLSILGIGTNFLDNVYQVGKIEYITENAVGFGITTDMLRITTNVQSYNNLTGIGNSQFFGRFSWGRLYDFSRSANPKEFVVSLNNGISGLSTAPIILRNTPMRSLYTS